MPVENLEEPDASTVMTRKRFISSSLQIHVERIEADLWNLLFSSVSLIVELPSNCYVFSFLLPPTILFFIPKSILWLLFSWLIKKYQFVKVLIIWSWVIFFLLLCYSYYCFYLFFHFFFIFLFFLFRFIGVFFKCIWV